MLDNLEGLDWTTTQYTVPVDRRKGGKMWELTGVNWFPRFRCPVVWGARAAYRVLSTVPRCHRRCCSASWASWVGR